MGDDGTVAPQVNPTGNIPLVVVKNSGGFVRNIIQATPRALKIYSNGCTTESRGVSPTFVDVQNAIPSGVLADFKGAFIKSFRRTHDIHGETVDTENFVFVHDFSQGGDISGSVLYALMTSAEDELSFLKLAIIWDRLENFVQCVNERRKPLEQKDVSELLLLALQHNRHNFIDELAKLDLGKNLRMNLQDLAFLYNRGAGTQNLRSILNACGLSSKSKKDDGEDDDDGENDNKDSENEDSEEEKKKMLSMLLALAKTKIRQRPLKRTIYLDEVYILLKRIFAEMDINLYREDKKGRLHDDYLSNELNEPLKHLVIWAVLMDYPELAHSLLQHCPNPTCMALLGSAVYDHCSRYIPSYNNETKIRYREQAQTLENMASQIATTMHEKNKVTPFHSTV
ncbi:unnamed protein product [Dibothriocephalus latus]|uniref:TRPM-like domain-containing protein n=1 Tax=Dibothriocephalus latus TaxID=60516 RepID=A0A3P6UHS0_DIBLA|nr:unnamed protein product [Dibothriocephalus latus]